MRPFLLPLTFTVAINGECMADAGSLPFYVFQTSQLPCFLESATDFLLLNISIILLYNHNS